MFKLLIADNESYTREEIKKIINWKEYGFILCDEGYDGEDTYKKVLDSKPNLVIIDIKMDKKSGLDVIRDVKKRGFLGEFIIISNCSEFYYIKEAMKYGVKDYLLKPLDKNELIESIKEVKVEIEKKVKPKITLELNKEKVLEKLCLNKALEQDEILEFKNIKNFKIALIDSGKNNLDEEEIIYLESYLKEKFATSNASIFKVKNKIAILFCGKSNEYIYSLIKNIKIQIEKEMKEKIFITIGDKVEELKKINYSYETSKKLMDYKYLYLDDGIIYIEKIDKPKINEDFNDYYNEEKLINILYNYIEIGEITEIKKNFLLLEDLIKEKKYKEEEIKALLTTYYVKLKGNIISNYNVKEEVEINDKTIIEEIYKKNSLHEAINFLIDKFSFISKEIESSFKEKGIKKIIKYVENKYNSDLRLKDLAEIFNYNTSYLGKIFKDNTGKSFNSYLDYLRIEQAKKLILESKFKVYEICEKVGYKDIDYFYYKFKKYVGTSPLNYKRITTLDNFNHENSNVYKI